MAEITCPPLGPGSVDLSALSAALAKKGVDPIKAVEAATTRKSAEVPAAAPVAAVESAPAGDAS